MSDRRASVIGSPLAIRVPEVVEASNSLHDVSVLGRRLASQTPDPWLLSVVTKVVGMGHIVAGGARLGDWPRALA
jgi:hypothetical protein